MTATVPQQQSAPAPQPQAALPKVTKRKIYRDMSKCIMCGRCSNICPTGAIMYKTAIPGLCTHCNVCADVCPVKARYTSEGKIKPEEYGKPYHTLQSYQERQVNINCAMCMLCYEKCPAQCMYVEGGKLKIRKGDAGASIINCSLCGLCATHCPTGALKFQANRIRLNPELCNQCGECVKVCPPMTMRLTGKYPKGYCIMCARCLKACPTGALSVKAASWEGNIE